MSELITVNRDLPTDNANVLAGTLLDSMPADGFLLVFIASSQRDGIISITAPGVVGTLDSPPILRANGIPDIQTDMPIMVPVRQGQKVIVNYNEVTAGDAFSTIIFVPV